MEIKLTLALPRDSLSVPIVRQILTRALQTLGVLDQIVSDIEIALTEACTNVLKHAGDQEYEVSCGIDGNCCRIEVIDRGGGFDAAGMGMEDAPLTAETGHHQVRLELQGYADPPIAVDVQLDATATVDQRLWLRTPVVERLRPLLPGASIADVRFLRNGTLAVLQQLPGDGWQLWLRPREQPIASGHRRRPGGLPLR